MTIFIHSRVKLEDVSTANDPGLNGPYLQILASSRSGGSQGQESPCPIFLSLLTWQGDMPTEPVPSSQCAPWAREVPAHLGEGGGGENPRRTWTSPPSNKVKLLLCVRSWRSRVTEAYWGARRMASPSQ